jgi:sporulation-control protein
MNTDWAGAINQWMAQITERGGHAAGYPQHGNPAFGGQPGYGHHRGSGMGGVVAGAAAGVVGGMILGEVLDDAFEDDGGGEDMAFEE